MLKHCCQVLQCADLECHYPRGAASSRASSVCRAAQSCVKSLARSKTEKEKDRFSTRALMLVM
eukprot:1157477-Pelagomonas_calceolata.AAC.4